MEQQPSTDIFCLACQLPLHPRRKHPLCVDCLVRMMKEANIVTRRESFFSRTIGNEKKKCEYCLEDVVHPSRKTTICYDCIITALHQHKILERQAHYVYMVNKVHPLGDDYACGVFFDLFPGSDRSKRKRCDVCFQKCISPKRENAVCLDCAIDAMIQAKVLTLFIRNYFIPSSQDKQS